MTANGTDPVNNVLLLDARDRLRKRRRLLQAQYEALNETTALPEDVKMKMTKAAIAVLAADAKAGKKLEPWEREVLERERPDVAAAAPRSGAERKHDSISRYNRVPFRKCADMAMRKRLEKNPPRWLKTFFPRRFSLPWAPYHKDIIADSLYAIENGTNQLIVAPRGGGKSRPVMGVVLFSVLTGLSPFPVYAPWKSGNVDAAFRFWLAALGNNKELAEFYPEFCDPFRHAKGIAQKMLSLTWADGPHAGENTGARMAVSDGLIIMPESRGIIGSTTINGNPLGMAFDAPDGSTIRPTIVFVDDPQDDKTSDSPLLVEKTVRKVDADFGGMGGPDAKLSMIMCGTTKGKGCVVSHYRKNAEWNVKVTPRVPSWPTGFDPNDPKTHGLWADWNTLRQEGTLSKDGGKAPLAFYRAHRAQMIAGMKVSWRARFDSRKGQPDAFYSAMVDFYTLGPRAFASEQQQEPLEEGTGDEPYRIEPTMICGRVADRDAFVIPEWCASRIASTDMNPSYAFSSAILGFGRDQTAAVSWYGKYTKAPLPIPEALPEAERHRRVFEALALHGKELSALPCKPEVWHIDASGEYFQTVLRFCEQSVALCGLQAIASTGVGSKNYRPYGKNVLGQPREFCHMRSDVIDGRRRKWFAWQADYWREIAQRAWLGSVGAPGSVSLFKGNHREFAEQICREQLKGKAEVGGQMFWNWHTAPGPHDFGDVMAQAYAAAAWCGIGTGVPRPKHDYTPSGMRVLKRKPW